MDPDEQEQTQPATQQVLDPRRMGRSSSGLNEHDLADVLCILHPTTKAAIDIVSYMAEIRPEHVLQQSDDYETQLDEQETIILNGSRRSSSAHCLALRMSSETVRPYMGFHFGRNRQMSDIVIGTDTGKRISNVHFRIFVNENGVTMLEDLSTNGTLVDDVMLKMKDKTGTLKKTRMLEKMSTITILTATSEDVIKFVVHFPDRDSRSEDAYNRNFQRYVTRCAIHSARKPKDFNFGQTIHSYGMHWDGGEHYNVIGQVGKGAFATVYKLATKMDGEVWAAKELEKRRFMKNGQLDAKIDNEMQIMRTLKHQHIVEYQDFHEDSNFLYIIMEYIPFGDLQTFLARQNLKESDAKIVARQILSALAYLHQQRITHRDIKPDNILIKKMDPLEVCLSDFGLSKVVNDNGTFLKTFCGTLLYCAPEVFPFSHQQQGPGAKRRRSSAPLSNVKKYSQAVDIWSFAGVLWFAMCGKPPFEGVADATGRGMYENIMRTRLDPSPLRTNGVSADCINLLTWMLSTDPSERPTERECLLHPWLNDGIPLPDYSFLNDIREEEEEEIPEEPLSQLSLLERGLDVEEEDEVELEEEDLDFLLNTHHSKRIRTDPRHPRNQLRDRDEMESSPDPSFPSCLAQPLSGFEESFAEIQAGSSRPRLFGEIGQSALQSSGVLDDHAQTALPMPDSEERSSRTIEGDPAAAARNGYERDVSNHRQRTQHDRMDGVVSSPSLLGAESMVRELNMTSPQSPNSAAQTPNEPSTPKTPEVHQHSSLELSSHLNDVTPKAPVFDRQITIPRTPSFYYDPYDPSTHNLEYASKVSGYDFIGQSRAEEVSVNQSEVSSSRSQDDLPDTIRVSAPSSRESSNAPVESKDAPVPDVNPVQSSGFVRPPPRLGKFTATEDSFSPVVLKIDKSYTSWGRLQECTLVYPDKSDTRISKKAFTIYFHADGENVKELDEQGKDWTKLTGLHTGIFTCAKAGIYVNGVLLKQNDERGRALYGRLHTGDIVQVFKDTRSCLKFRCEFYHGAGKEPRPQGETFQIERGPMLPTEASPSDIR